VYSTYNAEFLNRDLGQFLTPAENSAVSFEGLYPETFLVTQPPKELRAVSPRMDIPCCSAIGFAGTD
jgi:hypothetical protein